MIFIDLNRMYMKRTSLIAALALMCMISCSRNDITVGSGKEEIVFLNVAVPDICTKAVGVTDGSEDAVHNLQVFVFRKDGSLDAYAIKDGAKSLTICTTAGLKDIVAVTNAPAISGVISRSALDDMVTSLQDNAPGNLVMTGEAEFEITARTPSVEIGVTRRVARIYLASVVNDFSAEAYRNEIFRIEKIYLVNASGSTGYFKNTGSGVFYNEGMLDGSHGNDNLKALLQDEAVDRIVGYGAENAYTVPHYFYCYPNPGTVDTEKTEGGLKCTKLVIEATLAGKTYYYPVPVGNILANHRYSVKVSITRPGSDDPDAPVSLVDAAVTVNVVPWVDGTGTDITI